MKLLLAQPRGYCAGVEMAIECLDRALALYGAPLYVYHQIVHNSFVVERYMEQGVIFVDDLRDVPRCATLIYSAHGVAPEVRGEAALRELNVIDATCPLVMKVHAEARHFTEKGYTTFFIGHRDHDESVGIIGEAPNRISLIESSDDVMLLDSKDASQKAYLTQTTLGVDDTQHIIEALRNRFPDIEGPRRADICYATQNRQEAVRALSAMVELALVVGSPNSSNSLRLVEVARAQGIPAYLIDGPDEISLDWFTDISSILLTAGASVPEKLVTRTVAWLRQHFDLTLEESSIKDESMRFQLPVELRSQEAGARQRATQLD
jgi:4-hydroxy-3-methylbut-2-enyl diphosphate reductase